MKNTEVIVQTAAAKYEAETLRLEAEKKRIQTEAEAAARQAAQKPMAQVEAAIMENGTKRDQFTRLIQKRSDLITSITVARIDLEQQLAWDAELQKGWEDNFGINAATGGRVYPNSNIYLAFVNHRPELLVAPVVIPRLKAWLEKKEAELANVEVEITAFSKD